MRGSRKIPVLHPRLCFGQQVLSIRLEQAILGLSK